MAHPARQLGDKEARCDTRLRELALFREARNAQLDELSRIATIVELPRDTLLDVTADRSRSVCIVVGGQVALGLFERRAVAERGERQRDATRGEQDGTLLPPGPLARTAKRNLALFGPGELFKLDTLGIHTPDEIIAPFAQSQATVALLDGAAFERLARSTPALEHSLAAAIAMTGARLRSITGIKLELLDFYVRNGLSVAGEIVRVRQLDLCIDCKQCEDACEERHGARRLTLGGYELGILDFVYTCRTCTDARCLTPCEHDAIKRDAATGEIRIIEDKCIGCSLCALSCPYGAIDMINIAEPDLASFRPAFKARLDKTNQLAFGAGKGRKAPARRIANKCDHCAGYSDQACVAACPTGSLIEIAPRELFRERVVAGKRKRLDVFPVAPFVDGINVRDSGDARVRVRKPSFLIWILGLAAFAAVLAEVLLRWLEPTWSVSYRLLLLDGLSPGLARLNVSYLAGSQLALTCGYLGTALMVLSMAYLLQRRFKWFRATATNQFWLDVHLMTGTVGPLFIALHSALRLTTWVSIPFWSMVAVVVSGVIGRYLYTLVPGLTSKHDFAVLEHRRTITELAARHLPAAQYATAVMDREAVRSTHAWEVGLLSLLAWVIADDLRRIGSRARDRRALRKLAPPRLARQIASHIDRVVFYERRRELAPRGKLLLKAWKRVHIPFSVVLLVTMLLHIAIALALV
ncbi:MAG TPA: 4Fe-4S binding protein [Kofleriaceae bacterium]